ncbi:MAG: hypothetical protein EZS28_017601 [Streblomastix strix]|uniref:Uncharacterized protein n=1 Tax=Streblomastix strix TaxID=222440 RepID=A0A5J4VWM0_9EUKA|nr:MAG: hypothetical protein EZS28_017601 [Streblomastix strix]
MVSEAVLHVGKEQDIRRQIEKELENEEQQEQQQDEFIEKEKQQLRVCFGVIEGISTIPDKLNDNNEDKQVNTETKAKIEREKRFIDEFRRAANLTNNRQSHTSSSLQFFFTLVSTQHLPFFLSHFGIHKERRLGIPGEGINTQNESDG